MSNRAGPFRSLADNENSEYLDEDRFSNVSGVNFCDDLDDSQSCDVGFTVNDIFDSSTPNSPTEPIDGVEMCGVDLSEDALVLEDSQLLVSNTEPTFESVSDENISETM